MHHRALLFAFVAPALSLAPSAQDERPQPLPKAEDALTADDVQERKIRFHVETLLDEYRQRHEGNAIPADVEDAVRRFVTVTFRGSYSNAGHVVLARTMRRVLREHGEDPLVLMLRADLTWLYGNPQVALPLFDQAEQKAAGTDHLLRLWITGRRAIHVRGDRRFASLVEATGKARDAALIALIGSPAFQKGGAREYIDLVRGHYGELGPERAAFVEAIAKVENANPYALAVLQGRHSIKLGWAARSSKRADLVTEEGWKGFGEHLSDAAKHFARAQQLNPEHPEAARSMLTVIGGLGGDNPDLRPWFDAAVAAQMDHEEAFNALLWFLTPRWGGSHMEMMELGQEALRTRRFDTNVPQQFRRALFMISREYEDARDLYSNRLVQRDLRILHNGYRKAARKPWQYRQEMSRRVCDLALGNELEKAAAVLETIEDGLDTRVLALYVLDEDSLMKMLEPHLTGYPLPTFPGVEVLEGYADATYPGCENPAPLPKDAGGPTTKGTRETTVGWLQRRLAAAYKEHGDTDNAWSSKATELVGTYVAFLNSDPGSPRFQEFSKELAGIVDAGCEDPLVLYVHSRMLTTSGKARSSLRAARTAWKRVLTSDYPPIARILVGRSLIPLEEKAGQREMATSIREAVAQALVDLVTGDDYAAEDVRSIARTVMGEFDYGWTPGLVTPAAAKALASTDKGDPWLRELLVGNYHVGTAARMQPGFAADTIQPHLEHVTAARRHLEAAHALHPEWPEAAAAMINLTTIEPQEVSPREWFDRAVKAQFDFEPAYRNFMWSLSPDRGGSLLALYKFAVECQETGRHDTIVPIYYLTVLDHLAARAENLRWVWASPDVRQRLDRFREEAAAAKAVTTGYLENGRCMAAWAAGRYDEAVDFWLKDERRLDPRWLANLRVEEAAVRTDLETWLERREKAKKDKSK